MTTTFTAAKAYKSTSHHFVGFARILEAATAIVMLLLAGSIVNAQPGPITEALLTDKDAFLILPAELLCGPVVDRTTISPTGSNVAFLRKWMKITDRNIPTAGRPPAPPAEEQEVIFWNAAIRRPTSLWRSMQPGTRVTLSDWMPTTESLLAVVQRETAPEPSPQIRNLPPALDWTVFLLAGGTERAIRVALPEGDYSNIQVAMSPRKPIGVLQLYLRGNILSEVLFLLHANGRIGAKIDVPAGTAYQVEWDADGNPVISAVTGRGAGNEVARGAIDLRTGHVTPIASMPKLVQQKGAGLAPLPFRLLVRRSDLKEGGASHRISPIWLETVEAREPSQALLTADGSNASLLPAGVGALYTSQNSAWFTPILKIDKATYTAARRAAQRMIVLNRAKQIGLAAIMYASDHSDVLPGPDGIEANISTYIDDPATLEGFSYEYPGGPLNDIKSPSETILGHITGPGGRAILYADGHVTWKNEGP